MKILSRLKTISADIEFEDEDEGIVEYLGYIEDYDDTLCLKYDKDGKNFYCELEWNGDLSYKKTKTPEDAIEDAIVEIYNEFVDRTNDAGGDHDWVKTLFKTKWENGKYAKYAKKCLDNIKRKNK